MSFNFRFRCEDTLALSHNRRRRSLAPPPTKTRLFPQTPPPPRSPAPPSSAGWVGLGVSASRPRGLEGCQRKPGHSAGTLTTQTWGASGKPLPEPGGGTAERGGGRREREAQSLERETEVGSNELDHWLSSAHSFSSRTLYSPCELNCVLAILPLLAPGPALLLWLQPPHDPHA